MDYQSRVLENSKYLAEELKKKGFKLVSDGTDIHMMLINLKPIGYDVDGGRVEYVLDLVNITTNKNTVPGDTNALNPNGIRVGTPAMTTRGFGIKEFGQVAVYIKKTIDIVKKISSNSKFKNLKEFKSKITKEHNEIAQLRSEVISFVEKYPVIGS